MVDPSKRSLILQKNPSTGSGRTELIRPSLTTNMQVRRYAAIIDLVTTSLVIF
jgi:hypothetical protein